MVFMRNILEYPAQPKYIPMPSHPLVRLSSNECPRSFNKHTHLNLHSQRRLRNVMINDYLGKYIFWEFAQEKLISSKPVLWSLGMCCTGYRGRGCIAQGLQLYTITRRGSSSSEEYQRESKHSRRLWLWSMKW